MYGLNRITGMCALGCAIFLTVLFPALPGGADGHRERNREHGGDCLAPVANRAYADACGTCHLAYQAGLLPAASWQKILDNAKDHFGEDLGLSPEQLRDLAAYLTAHAAERDGSKISRKVLRNLGGGVPLRVTETPYWLHKHQDDDVPPGAFQRKSVGSAGNCLACHPGAERGCYDDDEVRIPR